MRKFRVQITSEVGLHARPAALFVQRVSQFSSDVQIRNLTTGNDWVDGKSILSVLTLGVEKDHLVELKINGNDEQLAAKTIQELVDSGFELDENLPGDFHD